MEGWVEVALGDSTAGRGDRPGALCPVGVPKPGVGEVCETAPASEVWVLAGKSGRS